MVAGGIGLPCHIGKMQLIFNLRRAKFFWANIDTFNFDEWASLAINVPSAFEQRSRECRENFITKNGNSFRLRGLQCRIDIERIRARTAMQSCLRIYSLLCDLLLEFQMTLNGFAQGRSIDQSRLQPIREARNFRFHRKILSLADA